MNSQSIIACFAIYILLSLAVVSLVRGDELPTERPPIPSGDTSAISDWALAGIVWSDASLTKKLALAASSETEDPVYFEELQSIARQSHRTIELMEAFGWRQVEQPVPDAATDTRTTDASTPADADPALPSPAEVGQQIAQSLDTAPDRSQPPRRPAVTRELPTPPGAGEPSLPAPPRGAPIPRSEFELSPYRVEDKMDVIPGQPMTRAEAIRHGVQQAIAAGVGRGGLDGGVGRISERDLMTRSRTRPYSAGSIYDVDDYDPNIDYSVNNLPRMFSRDAQRLDLGVSETPPGPSRVIGDEDNLIADLARERRRLPPARDLRRQTDVALLEEGSRRSALPSIVEGKESEALVQREPQGVNAPAPRPTAIQRFTSVDEQLQADANWLQLHLDTNQLRWRQTFNQPLAPAVVDQAVSLLQIRAELAYQATSDERLRQALTPWVHRSR